MGVEGTRPKFLFKPKFWLGQRGGQCKGQGSHPNKGLGPKMVTGASQLGDPTASTSVGGSSASSKLWFDIPASSVELQPVPTVEGRANVGGSSCGAVTGTIRKLQLVSKPVKTFYPPILTSTGKGSSGS
jgi:hypothetical protein